MENIHIPANKIIDKYYIRESAPIRLKLCKNPDGGKYLKRIV